MLQLTERGLNCDLYWESEDMRRNVSVIPTSAMTGEGVPDLLYMILQLTQSLMASKLELKEENENPIRWFWVLLSLIAVWELTKQLLKYGLKR